MLISWLFSRAPRQALAVALIGAMTTGCYTTTMISPTEVPRLAVTPASLPGDSHTVQDLDGKLVTIGDTFSLKIDPRPDLPPQWAQWNATAPPIKSPLAAELRGPMLVIQGQQDPMLTQVPLAYVQRVRVREYSHAKTAGFSVGMTLAGITLFVGIGFLVAATAQRTFIE
jgi:hypothetical protein